MAIEINLGGGGTPAFVGQEFTASPLLAGTSGSPEGEATINGFKCVLQGFSIPVGQVSPPLDENAKYVLSSSVDPFGQLTGAVASDLNGLVVLTKNNTTTYWNSQDGGDNFTQRVAPSNFTALSMVRDGIYISPTTGTVIAGTNNENIMRSTDGGDNFGIVSVGSQATQDINCVFCDSIGVMYAGGSNASSAITSVGLTRSGDDGVTWTNNTKVTGNIAFRSFCEDDQGRVYAAGQNTLSYTDDRGLNWTTLTVAGFSTGPSAISYLGNDTLLVVGNGGYQISFNRGLNWQAWNAAAALPDSTATAIIVNSDLTLVIPQAGTDIYTSKPPFDLNNSSFELELSIPTQIRGGGISLAASNTIHLGSESYSVSEPTSYARLIFGVAASESPLGNNWLAYSKEG